MSLSKLSLPPVASLIKDVLLAPDLYDAHPVGGEPEAPAQNSVLTGK